MNYEILDSKGKVINIIVADEAFMTAQFPNKNYRQLPEVAPPPAPVETKITRLAFMNRFTDAEAIALDLASIGTTIEAASIRRYLSKVNAAEFIDLSRDDTRNGVMGLEAAGMIASGRAAAILDAPVAEIERFKG